MILRIAARVVGAAVGWFVCFIIFGLMAYDPSPAGAQAATVSGIVGATLVMGGIFAIAYWDHGKKQDEEG
jgi:hypothetical protein